MRPRTLLALAAVIGGWLAGAPAALALPALQLSGPAISHGSLDLSAAANATKADGGTGAYAWTTAGTSQLAYLVVSGVSATSDGDLFNITVQNDGGTLGIYDSGNGSPLADLGTVSTYFEVYEFNFDGALTTIAAEGGSGKGFKELFNIAINSHEVGTIHFDLVTIVGAGQLGDTSRVTRTASLDVQAMPEPGAVAVFAVGLLVAGTLIRTLRKT